MISIENIFDRVLAADEGECVAVGCSSFEEMERVRMQFYREMKKLRRAHRELAAGLSISRKTENHKWIVCLTKSPEISPEKVVFFSKDGKIEPFEKKEKKHGTGKRSTVVQPKHNRKKARKVTGDKP